MKSIFEYCQRSICTCLFIQPLLAKIFVFRIIILQKRWVDIDN